jgi:hypothetical protein
MPVLPPVTMKTFPEEPEILSVDHSGAGEDLTEKLYLGEALWVLGGGDGGTLGFGFEYSKTGLRGQRYLGENTSLARRDRDEYRSPGSRRDRYSGFKWGTRGSASPQLKSSRKLRDLSVIPLKEKTVASALGQGRGERMEARTGMGAYRLTKKSEPGIESKVSRTFLGLNEGETTNPIVPPVWVGAS